MAGLMFHPKEAPALPLPASPACGGGVLPLPACGEDWGGEGFVYPGKAPHVRHRR
jgi:hypothetical protein